MDPKLATATFWDWDLLFQIYYNLNVIMYTHGLADASALLFGA